MNSDKLVSQCPVRNESVVGAHVYSHSGEFSPQVTDFALPGRGMSFQFIRKYRSSLCQQMSPLGRGWTFTYAKQIEGEGNDILYHDGFGRTHRFTRMLGTSDYMSPDGFYAMLVAEDEKFLLKQRFGNVFIFAKPDDRGRLLAIEERNGNALQFRYDENAILTIDSLGRQITIVLDLHRVVQLQDHAKRVWKYTYNDDACLVEIIQPPTDDFPNGPRIKYAYDEAFRLVSITDPNGQTFLRNAYDDQGRVVRQSHGDGSYEFQYEPIGTAEAGSPVYRTHVRQKNGARLVLQHNPAGQVVERTLLVSAESLSPEDSGALNGPLVALTTKSQFNRHGELRERVYPIGNVIERVYDEAQQERRARGNLLRVTHKPAPDVASDQEQITTGYTYEPDFQRRRSLTTPRGHTFQFEYDDRGNLTHKIHPSVTVQEVRTTGSSKHPHRKTKLIERFEYNAAGQLIRAIDARGATTEYHYYPTTDPTGANGQTDIPSNAQTAGGYLARIVRDPASKNHRLKNKPAHLVTGFGYDLHGNITTIVDGKSNAMRVKYDTHNRVVGVISREPFNHEMTIRRDANGNAVEAIVSFEHHEFDPMEHKVILQSSAVRQGVEYNALNNIVRRTLAADGREISKTFIRDATENIVRVIQPLGNAIEYQYDERNLPIMQRLGAGTQDEAVIQHTYTPNGRRRSTTNGRGHTTQHHYDGFHRYRGCTNAGGTTKTQRFDEAGNITEIELRGDAGLVNERGEVQIAKAVSLLQTSFHYDELNRCARIDRAWANPATDEALGQSQYDETKGVVSTVIEYGDNHLPARVWRETGNILALEYDGADRLASASDETGESISVEYDENSNPVRMERFGPEGQDGEKRFRQSIVQKFDELDRPVTRSLNEELPLFFAYNALGLVTAYKNQAGIATQHLHDAFGRWIGRVTTATNPRVGQDSQPSQTLIQRVEWDDNGRLVARINAANHRTQHQYDALNRRVGIIYADGTGTTFERDRSGNIVRIIDGNQNLIAHQFDPLNRLLERHIKQANSGQPQVEQFHYDGLNRVVAAVTNSATTLRRYDSLSRLLEEVQTGHAIQYGYDSAGNRIRLRYPSGEEVHKAYDILRRVSEVRDGRNGLVAAYTYHSSGQLRHQNLGNVLQVTFTYEPGKNWLNGIVYKSTPEGSVVEGSHYLYDSVGNRMQEVQLQRGPDFGERYFYDSANRLIAVQYGVVRLGDPNSRFEQEVQYDLSPVATWQHKIVRDVDGQTLDRVQGVTNQRDAYQSLGNRRFKYDANGNRIAEEDEDAKDHHKRYAYDYANRLVHMENLSADGTVTQAIEYAYDAFNRQVLKRVIDAEKTRDYVRVWNGRQLIEELEEGKPSKSFIYGARVDEPLRVSRHIAAGSEELLYMFNGRGFVTGLVNPQGDVVEGYRYDVFRQPFLSELNGEPVNEPNSSSPMGNPFFAGGQVWDSDAGLIFGRGSAFDPSAGQFTSPGMGPFKPRLGSDLSGGVNPLFRPSHLMDSPGPWSEGYVFHTPEGLGYNYTPRHGPGIDYSSDVSPTPGVPGENMSPSDIPASWPKESPPYVYDPPIEPDPIGQALPGLGLAVGGAIGAASKAGLAETVKELSAAALGEIAAEELDKLGESRDYSDYDDLERLDPSDAGIPEKQGEADAGSAETTPAGDTEAAGEGGYTGQSGEGGYSGYSGGESGGGESGGGESGGGESGGGESGGGESGGGESGGGEGSGCFIAGTPVVLADGTTRPIETVKVGDYVVSRDEATGNTSAQRVLRTWIHNVQATLLLHLTNGQKVETTKEHRFFVTGQGFSGAGRLAPSATLSTQSEQSVQVIGIEPHEQSTTVYNLEVENFHTYFVGKDSMWVHNLKDSESLQ